jgi:membrane protein involved in colicin uptake
MTESDPAAKLERTADELEHNLDRLDDHISDAHEAAQARREEALPDDVAGDWEETRGAPGQGEDPEGAVGEHGEGEGATERDATARGDGEGGDD